jgi:hypothetical protein
MKMEQTEFSETSTYKIKTPGYYPKENIQHKVFNLEETIGQGCLGKRQLFIVGILRNA